MVMTKVKRKNTKKQNITGLTLSLLIIIFVNVIGSFVYTRFDLTSEKRYTLSEATKKLVKNLDDIVYFKIYLEGDFPAGFRRLRNETAEMLNQFRAYSDNIEYEFINPSEGTDKKAIKNLYQQLVEKGLQPTNLQVKNDKGGTSQQIIFPGAIVSYKERELPLQLLNAQIGIAPEAVLNNSIQSLEYNIASTIKKLAVLDKPKIAFLEGQGELDKYETGSIASSLAEYYSVERVTINQRLKSLDKFKAIIIAKPDSAFNDKDKFIIDQFIMKGGKILWLIDPVSASMDSLQTNKETMGLANDINIGDMLFKYGVRLNYNLIQDLTAMPIPIKTGNLGSQAQLDYLPWYFFPLIMPTISNPIVNNLNAIKFEFASSIDTVGSKDIKKTVLLSTSKYARTLRTPVLISLDIMEKEPETKLFNKPELPVAILLEGKFSSVFNKRIPEEIANDKEIGFRSESVANRMIVISDGDVIKNQLQTYNGSLYPLPLGYDKYTRETLGNKDFIMNCVDYLCDETGLISVRSREIKLRLLDKTKYSSNKVFWQVLNTGLPVLLIFIFGILQAILRKRKYRKS
jgi:ABC-2 type transport system permease protein